MPDLTVKSIDDMEAIYGGLARRARAELGVTAWGMQLFILPPDWDAYPNHNRRQCLRSEPGGGLHPFERLRSGRRRPRVRATHGNDGSCRPGPGASDPPRL